MPFKNKNQEKAFFAKPRKNPTMPTNIVQKNLQELPKVSAAIKQPKLATTPGVPSANKTPSLPGMMDAPKMSISSDDSTAPKLKRFNLLRKIGKIY